MKYEEIKNILITSGYIQQDYKYEILKYVNMLNQENKQLKMIIKEYERINKNKYRGFKIIDVHEYNIDELLSYKKYKDNWNNLKEFLEIYWKESQDIWFVKILNKMQELEQGSDSNE